MSLLINRFYRFGDFTLDTDQRVLLREGKPVALTPKVFDTLLILVEGRGKIVEKEELMRRLWPDSFVEEGNLTVNVQQLRKSLSDDARDPRYIGTVARRGYRFLADVEAILGDSSQAGGQTSPSVENSDVLSPDSVNELIHQIEVQESAPVINSANDCGLSPPEDEIAVVPAAGKASTRIKRRVIALAAATAIVLAGLGLAFWRFSSGSNGNSGEGKRVGGKSVVSPLKLEKVTATGQSRQVAISPDGKYLAYTRVLENKAGIWMRHIATNTNVEVVPAGDSVYGLAFANSGEYLYFVRGDPGTLYRVSRLGGVPTKTVYDLEDSFSISADDSQIAFIRLAVNKEGQREYTLATANSDGTGERKITSGIHPYGLDTPLWSPDGGSIICAYGDSQGGSQNVTLIEVSAAGGTRKELSSTKFFRIEKMAWLSRGSGLILSARQNLGDSNQLWRVSLPGMEISQITEGLSSFLDLSIASGADKAVASQATRISNIWVGSSREPQNLKKITQATGSFCWTPSGRLVYSSTASGNLDLWIMQRDGTEQRQLTSDLMVDNAPAVASDRYIVFVSNRTGALQIWRMNIDGSNQVELTDGSPKNYPAMSPDGKWVFYNSTDDWHLWRISVEGGEPVLLTDYPALYPSISPDGKMIACAQRSGTKREASILVLAVEGGQPSKRIEFPKGGFSGAGIKWSRDSKAVIYAAGMGSRTVIIKHPLGGSLPEEITSVDQDELFSFGYSMDGQFLGVIRGAWQHDIVLITDLNR